MPSAKDDHRCPQAVCGVRGPRRPHHPALGLDVRVAPGLSGRQAPEPPLPLRESGEAVLEEGRARQESGLLGVHPVQVLVPGGRRQGALAV